MRLIKSRRGGLDRYLLVLGVLGALFLAAAATTAFANPVTLKAQPEDADGRVTLGDIFDGAGAASNVEVGQRVGPSVVFEAGQLQVLAHRAGLQWSNPTGLRRVVVRRAAEAGPAATSEGPTVPTYRPNTGETPVPASAPAHAVRASAAAPTVRAPAGPRDRIIARNDMVEVAYEAQGMRLTITGRAEGNAAAGQRVGIRNLQSNRVIDAVAIAPGQAIAGPNARPAAPPAV